MSFNGTSGDRAFAILGEPYAIFDTGASQIMVPPTHYVPIIE